MDCLWPCLVTAFVVGFLAYGMGLNRGYKDAKRGEIYKDTDDDSEM